MATKQVTIQGIMTWDESAEPPYPSQGPGFPTHPIAPGGPPPGIWPSPGHPSHPIYNPPYPSQGPGFPTNPIAPGGPPPGIWPSPGRPSHPIVLPPPPLEIWPGPGRPSHPIVLPPPESTPDESWSWGYSPVYGWVVVPPEGGKPVPPAVEGDRPRPDQTLPGDLPA
jgi:hypothetical protein